MEIWYLAHPVSPDEHYTFEENMAHALVVARICHDEGFKVILPWWADCHYLDDNNPFHRAAGLRMDEHIAAHLGRAILTGHKVSSGMFREVNAVYSSPNYFGIIDAVGLPDKELAAFLSAKRKRFYA